MTAETLNAEALEAVTITETDEDGESRETVLHDAVCDGILHWPEGWLFNLREPSAEEQQRKAMQEKITMLEDCLLEMSEAVYA
ncbi:MAG: hypothetical protein IJ124_14560 [Clostridia bacterium]|nr:hypothetical protein [Clostridia bacterium]